MRGYRLFFLQVLVFGMASLLIHCAGPQSVRIGALKTSTEVRSYEVRELTTGKKIPVISVYEESTGSERTLVLEYYTALEMPSEHERIQREVEEIWDDLQKDADRMAVDKVYIVPSKPLPDEPPSDGISVYGIWFSIVKEADGRWRKKGGFSFP